MGSARGALQLLAQRLATERLGKPVALVWTKADVALAPEMEQTIRKSIQNAMPDVVEFSVSVIAGAEHAGTATELTKLLHWTLGARRQRAMLRDGDASSLDPLFLFGTRRQ
jgi:hypothetical protein